MPYFLYCKDDPNSFQDGDILIEEGESDAIGGHQSVKDEGQRGLFPPMTMYELVDIKSIKGRRNIFVMRPTYRLATAPNDAIPSDEV